MAESGTSLAARVLASLPAADVDADPAARQPARSVRSGCGGRNANAGTSEGRAADGSTSAAGRGREHGYGLLAARSQYTERAYCPDSGRGPQRGPGFQNGTHGDANLTLLTTLAITTKLVLPTPAKPILPVQTGVEAQQEEQSSGMSIFFSLLVLAICIILVHLLIKYRLHFMPESVAVVSLGILMGAVIKIIESQKLANWKEEEMFRPNMFFLLLLPPIIFESGYSLHKGNFFQNIGSITLFAVFGTAISASVVGGGIFFLGQADVIYKLSMTESFAFGSLISAVDPVATIAIFNALNVDPVLNMLVFGESILNDAVSIVLTNTAEGLTNENMSNVSGWQTFLQALAYFLKMFFGSAALGTLTGLISALISFAVFICLYKLIY
ncbi:hypothetical protein NDU88_001613 [Pleurodeles waltl]|uniref:Sodium/hydrogen exchanger 8 n=1 Tax=Pleurodeles waltl TaxID=8319 RepID=A0AAV7PD25_PLEWA|nr:hypothetical protein NDU88_001613 [Pleurodeles waltl]